MNGQWSPGPWVLVPFETWDAASKSCQPVANCYNRIGPIEADCTYADSVWINADDADAHLAAAAPDLYAALEKALNFITNTESEMGEKLPCGDAARAALAKAQGEAK